MMRAAYKNKSETFRLEVATLFEQHRKDIYKAAYRVTNNSQDAEDVVQAVFVKLIEKQPDADLVHNPAGYLYRAAIHQALDMVRAHRRQRLSGVNVNSLEVPAPPEPDREDEIQRMEAAMAKMKPEYVEILNLRYKEDYSHGQIARKLRRSVGAVAMELTRAKAELRRLIQEELRETRQENDQRGSTPALADSSRS
jgi:RNA polymerase sigma-70 factor (ECF subfamily)